MHFCEIVRGADIPSVGWFDEVAFGLRRMQQSCMELQTAIGQIRDSCKNIGLELMRIHPAVRALNHKETQDDLFKVVFEITREVEVIKKKLAALEKGENPPLV